MLLNARHELADRAVAATEERRILLAERLQAPVRADRGTDRRAAIWLAAQRSSKGFKALGLLKDARALPEIDPGQKLQEPGRRRIAARHQNRDHREFWVSGLPNERELPLILLSIADPVLADENGHSFRAADCLFKRRNPPEARPKRVAVEEGTETLRAKPAVQLPSGGFVAASVADKDVVGVAARHGASLLTAGGRSIPVFRARA